MNGPKVGAREIRERGTINFPLEKPAVPRGERGRTIVTRARCMIVEQKRNRRYELLFEPWPTPSPSLPRIDFTLRTVFKSFFIPLPHRKLRSHRVWHAFQSLGRRDGDTLPSPPLFRGALKIFQCVVNIPRSPSRSNNSCVQIRISMSWTCRDAMLEQLIRKVCESMNLESLLIDRAELLER